MNKIKFFESMKANYPINQVGIHTIKALNKIKFIKSYQIKN